MKDTTSMRHPRSSIRIAVLSVIGLLCAPGFAQNTHQPTGDYRDGNKSPVSDVKPARETDEQQLSTDGETTASSEEYQPEPEADPKFGTLIIDQLEYRFNEGTDALAWDAQGWYGGDYNRFWFKTEGEQETEGGAGGEAELQLLYGRFIARFWDFQAGIRVDQLWGSNSDLFRVLAVIGVQGLAPYRFDVEPALFISAEGDISARFTATKDVLITQKLIIQPKFETEIAVQKVEKFGIGQGLEYVELGLRLRYEFRREFAPYIGINWLREIGETASMSKRAGNRDSIFTTLVGVRLWF